MLLTPTYHVFEMYKGHQDARQLESYIETSLVGEADHQVPDLHISASQQDDGTVLVTVANLSDTDPAELDCALTGLGRLNEVSGRVLTGAIGDYNDFDSIDKVKPAALDAQLTVEGFKAALPACSVAAFTLK